MKQFTKYRLFVKHLTIKKLLNAARVGLSYVISLVLRRPIRWGMPVSLSIEPTNICNLHCPQCPVGLNWLTRPRGFIDKALYTHILSQSHPYLLNLFLYFQGEPFLHSSIIDLVREAREKNIFTGLSTNAQLISYKTALDLVKAGLSYIIISIDGIDQQTYEQYRQGGSLDKVKESIHNLLKAREKLNSLSPAIELQFLVLKHNEHQIRDFRKFCKSLGQVTCKIKTAQIEDFSTAGKFIPQNKKFSRYTQQNGKWLLKKKIKNRCWRLWNSVVITWDGKVLPCCYDKDAKYAFGSITEKPLAEIINNSNFKTFARTVLTDRSSIDICRNCNE